MSEELHICPYTGLRSFSEDEALYFKGRESQTDQMTLLLEKNKFLMVTGASGEGKSSLIFAGLIPNARAGFFKARYNNWVVADFRPERTPVKNMSTALSKAIGTKVATAETELRRGFSSLVDLYKSSELYIEEDERWQALPEDERKMKKRNAANLLVLVDQFEEFFTNPENFHQGAPSSDSQIVVNVLLETAKIALHSNLPIYVVCTMRSDYIGQCSAFRGLPEYIGFSQFFVPRLKRKEIKQVIEEPALLSGNRISQRLVERLVYDLAEGIDQLPILQHALSQVWLAANNGQEEMDLIHYAMVGGMPADELPVSDHKRFNLWFETLPEYLRKFYKESGLNRVIELHANRLYESAFEYYNSGHAGHLITQRDAKNIIALTFSCLTKIDNSRAVRNRMTLQEITDIIHKPGITTEVVGGVLNIFREESNSFLRPFKSSDPQSEKLAPESVIDITHESLIRNWGRLNKWATQEYEFYTHFLDFKKQMDRWIENGKSKDYLLPIGPLSFFENWYAKCNPNAYWIQRYVGGEKGIDSLKESEALLKNVQEFLRKSANKVIITRTFMKYGANRIAAVLTMLLMIIFSGYYWYDADYKKNSRVIERVRASGHRLLESTAPDIDVKVDFLITEERFEKGKLLEHLKQVKDPKAGLRLSLEAYNRLMKIDKHEKRPLKEELVAFIDEKMDSFAVTKENMSFFLEKCNLYISILAYDDYFNPNEVTQSRILKAASRLHDLLIKCFSDKGYFQSGISPRISMAIHSWLTFGKPDQKQINEITAAVSPFNPQSMFEVYYPKGSSDVAYDIELDHGGGYHLLACLYAAAGDVKAVQECFQQLLVSSAYFTGTFTFNDYTNVLGYCYQYGYRSSVPTLIQWISGHAKANEVDLYTGILHKTGYMKMYHGSNLFDNFLRSYQGYYNPNLSFLSDAGISQIDSDLEGSINKLADPSDRQFRLALYYKEKAVHAHKLKFDRGLPQNLSQLNDWLNTSWRYFESVPLNYLQAKITVPYRYWTDGKRNKEWTRKQLYLYPDHFGGWLNTTYYSDLFFNFIRGRKGINQWYTSAEDIQLLHYWVANYFELSPGTENWTFENDYPLSDSTFRQVLRMVEDHPRHSEFDTNLIYLVLANRAFDRGDTENGFSYFTRVHLEKIYTSANTYEYLNKTFVYNQVKDLSTHLAEMGRIKESMSLSESFEKPYQVIYSYVFNAEHLYGQNYDPQTFVMLDSALTKMDKTDISELGFLEDFRYKLVYTFGKMGGDEIEGDARTILKGMREGRKTYAQFMFIMGLAGSGNYYKASVSIPSSLTETEDLACRTLILQEACEQKDREAGVVEWKLLTDFTKYFDNYIFYEPF